MGEPKEYITIDNFSPGIFGDLLGQTGATATASPSNNTSLGIGKNGGAVIDDTFGCHADPTGALIPLPVRVLVNQTAWAPFGGNGQGATGYFPTGKVGYYVLDVRVISYLVTDDHDAQTERDCAFILFGAFYDPDNGGGYKQVVWGVVMGLDINLWKVVHYNRYAPSIDPSPALSIPSGCVAILRHVDGERDANDFLDYGIYHTQNSVHFMLSPSRDGSVGDDNTSWATGDIPTDEETITSFQADTGRTTYPLGVDTSVATFSGCIGVFPDPLDLNSWYPRYIGGRVALPGFMSIAHQGRAVMASLLSRGFGSGYNLVLDRVSYSPVYNAGLATSTSAPTTTQAPPDYRSSIAGDENVNPIGTLGSIMAAELLVVKHGRGGVLMRGDMDNFEAVALPYIESTYGIVSQGVSTPIGFVYGSRNGVFAWSGGQETKKLSTQIDGYFWEHATDLVYTGNQARFGYWHPFVCVPNDFLFNIESSAWWKIEDSSDTGRVKYSHYDTGSLNGKLYAFPYMNTPGADPVVYSYDPDVLRSSYSWKSLPLIESRRRLLTYEDVTLTVTVAHPYTATNTIVVTLIGIAEDGTQVSSNATTIVLNATSVVNGTQVTITHLLGTSGAQGTFTARYVQVLVTATASSGPAPKIHKIDLGVTDRQRQRVNN